MTHSMMKGLALCVLLVGLARPAWPEDEDERAAPVKAVKAATRAFPEITSLIGATELPPRNVGRISTAVEGRVASVLFGKVPAAEGQEVKAGDVIVQLDDRILRANRDKVKLQLEEQDELARQAELAWQAAQIDVERLGKLRSTSGPLSGLPLVGAPEVAKSRLTQADAESKKRAVELRAAALRKELQALELQIELYTLRAPIDGRLGTLLVAPGQTLTVGTLIAEVVDLRELEALCYVPPSLVSRLSLGQVATVSLPGARPPRTAAAKLVYIAAQAHPDTGNLAVELRFPNPQLEWRSGAVCRVDVVTKPAVERACIPETCLMEDTDPPGAIIVVDARKQKDKEGKEETRGKAKRVRLEIGVRDPETHSVEVLNQKDALFVSEGWAGLRDDDPVIVEPDEEKDEKKEGDKKEKD